MSKRKAISFPEDISKRQRVYQTLLAKRQCEQTDERACKRIVQREYPTERLMQQEQHIEDLERQIRLGKHIIAQQQLKINELEYELRVARQMASCAQLQLSRVQEAF